MVWFHVGEGGNKSNWNEIIFLGESGIRTLNDVIHFNKI
jgi:hypothetical protein